MYVCMYVRMYVCQYVYTYVSMYVCLCVRMHVRMHVRMYVYMFVCVYVCMHVRMYVYMYVCMYLRMYVCMYVCILADVIVSLLFIRYRVCCKSYSPANKCLLPAVISFIYKQITPIISSFFFPTSTSTTPIPSSLYSIYTLPHLSSLAFLIHFPSYNSNHA